MEVSRCTVEIDGKAYRVKNFKEHKRESAKRAKHMGGYGTIKQTTDNLFSIDYPYQQGVPEPDFKGMTKTFSVDEEGGGRVTFSPIYCLEIGEYELDDEKEKAATIEFAADNRTSER